MKNRNKRELEKYWAKEAAKKTKLTKKDTASDQNSKSQAAAATKETTKQ
jgi:hypothetical protein